MEQFSKSPLSLKIKSIALSLTNLTYLSKIDDNLVKITENVTENNGKSSTIHKYLNLHN